MKNPELLRGKSFGPGAIKKINGSWAQGVKPKAAATTKTAKKVALKSTTSLTRPSTPAFKKAVKTAKVPNTKQTVRKGVQMLKKKAQPTPKNVRPAKIVKRSAPKR